MEIIIFLILFVLWLVFWKINEKRHYKSIIEREEQYKNILVVTDRDTKSFNVSGSELLTWNVAVSIDYFKMVVAGFINFFWGRITVYEKVLDRARREATLRLKEEASKKGYNCIVNLRLDTSTINWKKANSTSCAEVLASGTWVMLQR
jgi:uncharacterized protein YbjQ (UPF0145 family)